MAGEGDAERLVVLLEARIRDFEKNMQKASGTADRSYDRMRRGSQSATRQMEADMVRSTTRINQALASTSTMIGSFGKGLVGGIAGALTVGGLSQIAGSIRGIVAEGAGLVDTAGKLGLTTTALQELHFAATQGGASVEDMDKAIGVFTKGIGEATQKSGELYKVLTANAVAIRDQRGQVRAAKDLLRDYADLIKNAGSEQERARLTTIAFGRSGADLANVFRDGAEGVDAAAAAAHRLGIVVDDDMLQQIAELDDRWDAFATTLEKRSKIAILDTVTWLDQISGGIQRVGAAMDQFRKEQAGESLSPGALIGNFAGDPQAAAEALAKARLAAGLKGSAPSWAGRDEWLGTVKETKLPPPPERTTRDRAAEKAERERKAVEDLIASLEHEQSLIGASEIDREVANNLRRAGAVATEDQRLKIEELTRSTYAQEEAQRRLNESMEYWQDASMDFASGFLDDIRNGTSAVEALGNAFDNLADRLIDMALNELITGLFSNLMGAIGGGGGGFMSIGGTGGMFANGAAFSGGRVTPFANGGVVTKPTMFPMANGAGLMGEAGPEAVMPLRRLPSGRLGVESQGGGGDSTVVNFAPTTNITVQGNAGEETLGQIEAMMARREKQFEARVPDIIRRAKQNRQL